MLWQTYTQPQRPTPLGGMSCPTPGTSHQATEQLNKLGRWRT